MATERPVRLEGALGDERGQALLLMLGVVGALLAGVVLLFAFGNALGAKGRYSARPTWRRSARLR